MEPVEPALKADPAAARLPRPGAAAAGRADAARVSPGGVRRRGPAPAPGAGGCLGGQCLPAAGWRLRRELRRVLRRQHPRQLPGVPEDGGGADLRGVLPAREGRTHGRAVRPRSEEYTSELQYLMRCSYAVFCLNTTQK